jgi:hypothetical protein
MTARWKRRAVGLASMAALIAVSAFPASAIGVTAQSGDRLPRGSEPVSLGPADFTTRITNPYFPLKPGQLRVYRSVDLDGSKTRVTERVTRRTKVMANGVTARVVHVVDTQKGQMIEETFDYYAQDRAGNVWYLGEDTRFFRNGKEYFKPDSWQSGVNGAQPGVIMPARPRIGQRFREEYSKGVAQDRLHVLGRVQQVEVSGRRFMRVLLFEETTPLEPEVADLFFFARGVGVVLAVEVSGGTERTELIRFKRR